LKPYAVAAGPRSTRAMSYATLKDHLVRGAIAPGTRLVERSLSLELGISRTPLREALLQLESERLVLRTPGGSWYVPVLSEREIRDIFSCRAVLEALAAKMVVERASDREIAELDEPTRRSEKAYKRGSLIAMTDANSDFHLSLYRATDSDWLMSTVEPLRAQTTRMRFLIAEEVMQQGYPESHRVIFDALTRRDEVTAAKVAQDHVLDDLAVVLRNLKAVQRVDARRGRDEALLQP
jgi:DNA-binding GntR family transcriptional regulator